MWPVNHHLGVGLNLLLSSVVLRFICWFHISLASYVVVRHASVLNISTVCPYSAIRASPSVLSVFCPPRPHIDLINAYVHASDKASLPSIKAFCPDKSWVFFQYHKTPVWFWCSTQTLKIVCFFIVQAWRPIRNYGRNKQFDYPLFIFSWFSPISLSGSIISSL